MKKISLFLLFIIISATSGYCDANIDTSGTFLSKLSTCSEYYSETRGLKLFVKTEISGWDNDKCQYRNEAYYHGSTHTVACRFSKDQINQLLEAVNKDVALQKKEGKQSNLENFRLLWRKYLNDANTCSKIMSINY